jgi:hypothetical protein
VVKEIDPTAKVWYYPLLVGVAGTIYMNTSIYLEALGIKGEALKKMQIRYPPSCNQIPTQHICNQKKARKA